MNKNALAHLDKKVVSSSVYIYHSLTFLPMNENDLPHLDKKLFLFKKVYLRVPVTDR